MNLLDYKMFRLLTGQNQRIYADLLMLIWDRCGMLQDYSMGKSTLLELAESYIDNVAETFPLDEESETEGAGADARSQGQLLIPRLRDAGWKTWRRL